MNGQKERLRNHLESGKSITRLSALTDLGIFELSSRIGELVADGFEINRQRIKVVNRFGEVVNVMEYKHIPTPKITKQIEFVHEFRDAYKYLSQQINKLGYEKELCEIVIVEFSYKLPIFNEVNSELLEQEFEAFEQGYFDYITSTLR